jgi:hypothetical protein
VALESVAIIMIVVGLWYYFVYEFPELEEAWLWSAVFLASAVLLALHGLRLRRSSAGRARSLSPRSG